MFYFNYIQCILTQVFSPYFGVSNCSLQRTEFFIMSIQVRFVIYKGAGASFSVECLNFPVPVIPPILFAL